MARKLNRLSAKDVQNKKRSGYWCDGGGLYLQVSPRRTKSWVLRYTLDGRTREMGLGGWPDATLAAARKKAEDARRLVIDGVDPIDERAARRAKEKAGAMTFAECAAACIEDHKVSWKNAKHAQQWKNTLATYVEPKIGPLRVNIIDTEHVLSVLKPIWTTKTETASRVRQRVESVLDWATARNYRQGENPARWRGHLKKLLPEPNKVKRVAHHPALAYSEIGAFIESLRQQEGTAARALELTILTGCHTGEVIGARSEEFDLEKAMWTIPASRMKANREHRVPLAPRAVEIVRNQPPGDYVFPGQRRGRPLSNMAMLQLLKRMGRGDLTVHGFRSTFRDWCAEQTNFPRELAEAALAHVLTDKTEAAYQRGDLFEKRRELMDAWAHYCSASRRGNVVQIHRKA
jgi:integrase